MRHVFHRVPDERVRKEILPALGAVRRDARLERLAPYLDVRSLPQGRFVLTGRRYLLFGPEERHLMHAAELFVKMIGKASEESVVVDQAVPRLVELLRAEASPGDALPAWERVTRPDHNLPDWMAGEGGPTLLTPQEVDEAHATLEDALSLPAVAEDLVVQRGARPLSEFLRRARGRVPSSYRQAGRYAVVVVPALTMLP